VYTFARPGTTLAEPRERAIIDRINARQKKQDQGKGKKKQGKPPEQLHAGTLQIARELSDGMGDQSGRWDRMGKDFGITRAQVLGRSEALVDGDGNPLPAVMQKLWPGMSESERRVHTRSRSRLPSNPADKLRDQKQRQREQRQASYEPGRGSESWRTVGSAGRSLSWK